jgi:hypothetical protein
LKRKWVQSALVTDPVAAIAAQRIAHTRKRRLGT